MAVFVPHIRGGEGGNGRCVRTTVPFWNDLFTARGTYCGNTADIQQVFICFSNVLHRITTTSPCMHRTTSYYL